MNWWEREPLRERSPDRIWHLLGMPVKMHLGEGVSVETKRVLVSAIARLYCIDVTDKH
jgi:hypothetical protein